MDIEDKDLIKKLVPIMETTVKDLLPDYRVGISSSSTNGISQCVWSRRNEMISHAFSNDNDVRIIKFERGFGYDIYCVLSKKTGILYVLFNETNLAKNVLNVQKKGLSTHYSFMLLGINSHSVESFQLSIFDENDYVPNNSRSKICRELLRDSYEDVKKVEFLSVAYFNEEVVHAELNLYDSDFSLVDNQDITSLFNHHDSDEPERISNSSINVSNNQMVTLKKDINEETKNDDKIKNIEDIKADEETKNDDKIKNIKDIKADEETKNDDKIKNIKDIKADEETKNDDKIKNIEDVKVKKETKDIKKRNVKIKKPEDESDNK
ncbi:DUF5986 family protein [Fructilactobacillus frigidiflavus]|uniref:DUF5986 family protein n=1 Tax=Fructilactobacillus frigidiflavus TaxID=3242688 RepID=UPI003757BD05